MSNTIRYIPAKFITADGLVADDFAPLDEKGHPFLTVKRPMVARPRACIKPPRKMKPTHLCQTSRTYRLVDYRLNCDTYIVRYDEQP